MGIHRREDGPRTAIVPHGAGIVDGAVWHLQGSCRERQYGLEKRLYFLAIGRKMSRTEERNRRRRDHLFIVAALSALLTGAVFVGQHWYANHERLRAARQIAQAGGVVGTRWDGLRFGDTPKRKRLGRFWGLETGDVTGIKLHGNRPQNLDEILGCIDRLRPEQLLIVRLELTSSEWKRLASIRGVEDLRLIDTGLRSEELLCLSEMRQLRYLILQEKEISAEAVSELRLSLPNCRVFWRELR